MIPLLLALLLGTTPAHGLGIKGWWQKFCEKNLIADDPHQYEELSNEDLLRQRYQYELKVVNGIATYADKRQLEILEGEVQRRYKWGWLK